MDVNAYIHSNETFLCYLLRFIIYILKGGTAELLHIRQNTYSQYETGRRQIPIALLIQLSEFYETSVDYLLGLTNEMKPYPRSGER